MSENKDDRKRDDAAVPGQEQPDLDPYEINFLPEFEEGRGPREPFVNEHGVVIGDHEYESENSPLQQWSKDTDPSIMAGDQWVHPFKDIGFHTEENRNYFEKGITPQGGIFMHPSKDVAYEVDMRQIEDESVQDGETDAVAAGSGTVPGEGGTED